MKDELGCKIMVEFVELKPKTCSFLTYGDDENKKAKGTKDMSENENLSSKIIKIV